MHKLKIFMNINGINILVTTTDIIICNIPGTMDYKPFSAPAALKSAIEDAGFSCMTIDFNIRLYRCFKHDLKLLDEIQVAFIDNDTSNQRPEIKKIIEELLDEWGKEIKKYNPAFLGISVFTYQNQQSSLLLSQKIREIDPKIEIVLGGQGLASGGINGIMSFPQELKDKNIIDHYIRSEGEKSIVDILKRKSGTSGVDMNTFDQITDLDSISFPNYDDYELDEYKNKSLPVTGSRGCIRRCTFCDIHDHWKYTYRDGEKIAEEIITSSQKYNVFDFKFTDSLVNGNIKQFNKFTSILSEHNTNTSTKKISWSGQFIFRSPSRQVNDVYWEYISKSGGKELALGLESGSEKVRNDMKKGFSDNDVYYTLEKLEQFNISCSLLLLIGYPTEELEDHEKTLNLLKKYQHLSESVITQVSIGSTLGILPNTPIARQAEQSNIVLDPQNENNWICLNNPDLNLRERLRRRQELIDTCHELGFQTSDVVHDEDNYLIKHLYKNLNKFEKKNVVQRKYFEQLKLQS